MARYGTTDKVPWSPVDSDWYAYADDDEQAELWQNLWKQAANSFSVNVSQTAAEFYMLELISAHVGIATSAVAPASELPVTPQEFFELMNIQSIDLRTRLLDARRARIGDMEPEERLGDVRRTALVSLAKLVDKHEPIFHEYLNLAIGGELRHHQAVGEVVINSNRPLAWCDWHEVIKEHGSSAILKAAELFREFPEGAGYGGKPWAQAADVLYQRMEGRLGPDDETNNRLFLDRVWTLEHNNGCILNKIPWIDLEDVQYVLNAHAAHPVNVKVLYKKSGTEVKQLWDNYLEACNALREREGQEVLENDAANTIHVGVCSGCGSNVELGHKFDCYIIKSTHFDGGKFDPDISKHWYTIAEDIDEMATQALSQTADHLPLSATGILSLDEMTPVEYKITVTMYTEHDEEWSWTDEYIQSTYGEMLRTNVDVRTVGDHKSSCWNSKPNWLKFHLSCYALDGTGDRAFRIARAYDYCDLPNYTINTINLAKWLEFNSLGAEATTNGQLTQGPILYRGNE